MRYYVLFFILLVCTQAKAQHTYQHLNHEDYNQLGRTLQRKAPNLHTAVKPILRKHIEPFFDPDSTIYRKSIDPILPKRFQQTWFWRKFRNEDFVDFKKENFRLLVNPLLQLEKGQDRYANTNHYVNTRGIMLEGTVGEKFGFYTSFYENQASLPFYLDQYADTIGMVPGQGSPKLYKVTDHDFSRAEAYICFSPTNWLTVQLGHGKHFIGEGYRSLLLSDNAFLYPYLKIKLRYKNWQWVMLRSQLNDFGKPTKAKKVWHYEYHFRRYNSWNYISYKPTKAIELGLFESTMWQSTDTITHSGSLSNLYYVPIPLLHTAANGLNGKNNVMLGLNLKIKPIKDIQLYGQIMIDDIELKESVRDKYGFQLGLKYWDVVSIKNLFLQAEYNLVRPYAYAHNDPRANWTHSNQPLSHPLGANFNEALLIGHYAWKDFSLDTKVSYATFGIDSEDEHWGRNIYLSDKTASSITEIKQGQGTPSTLMHLNAKLAFTINPRTNLQLYVMFNSRQLKYESTTQRTDYFGFGIRSSLYNTYYDF